MEIIPSCGLWDSNGKSVFFYLLMFGTFHPDHGEDAPIIRYIGLVCTHIGIKK